MTQLHKLFTDSRHTTQIIVNINRSNIEITIPNEEPHCYSLVFSYNNQFVKYFQEACYLVWPNFKPKKANSFANAYWNYYDSDLDSKLELLIANKHDLIFETHYDSNRLYKFNKLRSQSFVYDLLHRK